MDMSNISFVLHNPHLYVHSHLSISSYSSTQFTIIVSSLMPHASSKASNMHNLRNSSKIFLFYFAQSFIEHAYYILDLHTKFKVHD